jgi:hypothetical protein
VNEPPVIKDSSLPGHSVIEGQEPGSNIGAALQVWDPEAEVGRQQVTWEIQAGQCLAGGSTNVDPCPIRIASCDGQLVVNEGADIDFENFNKYVLTVIATDDGMNKLTDSGVVTVTVIGKNDPPIIPLMQECRFKENPTHPHNINTFCQCRLRLVGEDNIQDSWPSSYTKDCKIVATDVDNTGAELNYIQVS